MNNSNNGNKNIFLLLTGAVAGAATMYYLNTENGKKLRQKIADGTSEMKSNIEDKVATISDEIISQTKVAYNTAGEKIADMTTIAANQIDSVKNQLNSKVNTIENTIESEAKGFKNGVAKAQSKLKNATMS